MGDYRKLAVWQKSHQFVLNIYKLSANFPKDEMYGLTSQIRRAAVSIPSNIAEGSGRAGDGDLIRFLHIASGSAHEVDYQLLLVRDLGMLENDFYLQLEREIVEIKRMLGGLIHSLESKRH